MLRIVAYILKAIDGFKGMLRKSSVDDAVSKNNNFGSQGLELSTLELSHISAGELLSAENTLVGLIQQRSYAGEINIYRDKRNNGSSLIPRHCFNKGDLDIVLRGVWGAQPPKKDG